jgi:hypothetical protein
MTYWGFSAEIFSRSLVAVRAARRSCRAVRFAVRAAQSGGRVIPKAMSEIRSSNQSRLFACRPTSHHATVVRYWQENVGISDSRICGNGQWRPDANLRRGQGDRASVAGAVRPAPTWQPKYHQTSLGGLAVNFVKSCRARAASRAERFCGEGVFFVFGEGAGWLASPLRSSQGREVGRAPYPWETRRHCEPEAKQSIPDPRRGSYRDPSSPDSSPR